MECNKEEAIKAMEFAEMKLRNGDFQGARKLALKARNLFPGIDENISQLLIVCEVHCAANNNIASEKDWYGILQNGGIVDESTIKRQFRKLALLLHPDKNKFVGAEAAFKLIGEANAFLLDPEKKFLYDRKYRAFKRNVVPQSSARQVYQSDTNSDGRETFWTICSFCDSKFKYFRIIENKRMRCPICSREYVAYDINAQSARQATQPNAVGSEGLGPAVSSCESVKTCSGKGKRKVQTNKQDGEVICEESVQPAPKQKTKNEVPAPKQKTKNEVPAPKQKTKNEVPAPKQKTKNEDMSCRRSSRQKVNVSYNEDEIPDDFPDLTQWSEGRKSGSCRENKEEHDRSYASPKESSLPGDGVSAPKVESTSVPEICKCPDPEFSNFDKNNDEVSFSVDQIWACYDSVDGMPRFYAHIRKVLSSPFVVKFTWLEPAPEDEKAINWASVLLPMSCGRFYPGTIEETSDRLIFSHQIKYEICSNGGSYLVYPRKGEIWAVFSDWDIGWSTDPESHKPFRYDMVEIFSDLHQRVGIDVCYLSKVAGFVSVYERSKKNNRVTHVIPPNELLRFSHRVPFSKLSGTEREGIPAGSFELDPAALPSNPDELLQPGEMKMKMKMKTQTSSENVNPKTEDVSKRIPSLHIDEKRSKGEIFHDFEMDRAAGNYSRRQIWAMYSGQTGLPMIYGVIKKVEQSRLLTALLEPCSKELRSCGIFKVSAKNPQVYFPNSFSHMMDVKYISQDKVEIYPRKGEVWAIFKNWGAGMLQENPLYDIVEVCKSNETCIEVWLLQHFSGTRSIFKHQREERRYKITLKIPSDELPRFSHQVPAFKLTGQKDGCLRGFWELDPAAVPHDVYLDKA